MNKLRAAFIHLIISFSIVTIFFSIIFFIWYPKPFFTISNTIEPVKLLILIDVIIGPLLTFIVYKKNKSTLVMDLSIIALLQIIALAYGGYTIHNGRPVLVVLNNGEFNYMVKKFVEIDQVPEELQISIFSKPKYAYLQQQSTADIYQSLNDVKPIIDFDNELQVFSYSKDDMLSKFSIDEEQILGIENKYKLDNILYFLLDNDKVKYFVVYSQKQKQIIDKLEI